MCYARFQTQENYPGHGCDNAHTDTQILNCMIISEQWLICPSVLKQTFCVNL